jgi:hypothetical protein
MFFHYHKVSKTAPWRKIQKNILITWYKLLLWPLLRGGGGDKGFFIPGIIYFMPWNKNKKHQKLIYPTELRLKTLKNCFFAIISIEFKY